VTGSEHCVHCGRPLDPGAQFCGGCGSPVAGGGPPTVAVPATPYDAGSLPPADAALSAPGGNRRRVVAFTIAGVAVVAVVVIVAVLLATRSDNTRHPASTTSNTTPSGPIVMPSLITLKRTQAFARLGRAGIPPDRVTVKTTPRTDVAPGTVLTQDPAAGLAPSGRVTLTISKAPAKMPNFVGHRINAARATLSTLNVTLTTDDALDGTVADGTILDQSPAAGAPFADALHLTVARTPVPTNLGDLQAVGPAPERSSSQTISGTAYADSLFWDTSVCPGSAPTKVTYNLDARYRRFVAIAGLGSETERAADQVRIHITVDGTVVLAGVLDERRTVPVALDVTGHNQLLLTFTPVPGNSPNCTTAKPALGRARLLAIVGDLTRPAN
jgi:NPCBM/NEW2 domain/PASTA domain/zinc-ribbon domain